LSVLITPEELDSALASDQFSYRKELEPSKTYVITFVAVLRADPRGYGVKSASKALVLNAPKKYPPGPLAGAVYSRR
jgi:hypothetical protein